MIRRRPAPLVSRKQAALFGLCIALASVALVVPLLPFSQQTQPGDIAPRTLVAAQDAQYESNAATAIARDAAASSVVPVPLPLDPAVRQEQQAKLDKLLDQIRALRTGPGDLQSKMTQIAAIPGAGDFSNAGRLTLLTIDPAGFELFVQRVDRALAGILARADARPNATPDRINKYLAELPTSGTDPAATVPPTDGERFAFKDVLTPYIVQNDVDQAQTAQQRDNARRNVAPITKSYNRGQVIVAEGDRIDGEAIEALRATGVIDGSFDAYDFVGGALFALAAGVALAVFTYLYQPFAQPTVRRMILIGFTLLATLAGVRIGMPLITPDTSHYGMEYALPVAAAAMVAAAFADLSFAAVVAIVAGLFAAFIPSTLPELAGSSFVGSLQSLELAMVYIASGLAGAVCVYRAERLNRYAIAALATMAASGGMMAVFWLVSTPRTNVDLGWLGVATAINGVASTVIALAVFVLLAGLLGVTTRLQLMELAQPEHPLLRRLQDEAPGTYHHSMMVGALAERGADRIGADALVARVGAYYHDIGKLVRPTHFIENSIDGVPNPHDALDPEASAAVIREHISAGLELARRYHLPPLVRDFIPQHHGTRLVTYFYRRAVNDGGKVDPAPFRYTGPRPQTKEAAIVMLADSCEAVVRARQDTAQPGIDQLIDGVFAERLAESQLDESDITMRELHQVAASFKATLRAVYHPRVPYPEITPEELAGLARGENVRALG